jgi:lysophospholipase L1-like esterase
MRTVLCYGDSNTWGYDAATAGRFPRHVRWPGVLRRELGEGYVVIEEGLNGRTTVWDDPIEGHKNGREYLIPCLESHKPIDLVAIMLGTNDLKKRFSLSAFDIAHGAGVLLETVLKSACGPDDAAPAVLLIAPPRVGRLTEYAEMLEGAEAKALKFAEHYRRIAEQCGCEFLDAALLVTPTDLDGIHLAAPEHARLGQAVADVVKRTLG